MENIVEKGEIAHFEQFLLFQQCFIEAFFFNELTREYMEERVRDSFIPLTLPDIYVTISFITIT